ncbi:MAG: hypothetical protein U9Q05_02675 [Thermodesulfobacteriota bacterium]|nr:hypothetical protein [Thermodesulfobacteriota bacterium]
MESVYVETAVIGYGSVRHRNHIHFRCNTYKAELSIVPADNYWKLTGVQLLEEKRVL